ncbi:hypothetical protein ACIQU6_32745 [Streptomyces sp. NPDC090442]
MVRIRASVRAAGRLSAEVRVRALGCAGADRTRVFGLDGAGFRSP